MSRATQCPAWSARRRGFTLAEILVVVAIIGVIAAVAVPLLTVQDSKRLDVAAEEVRNALRFAIAGGRSGNYVLVDAKTSPGRIKIFTSDATGAPSVTASDPLTKRAFDMDITGGAFSAAVGITPRFMQSGIAYPQLLIGPAGQLQVFDGPSVNKGALQAGSKFVLSLGSPSITVSINEITGFVTVP